MLIDDFNIEKSQLVAPDNTSDVALQSKTKKQPKTTNAAQAKSHNNPAKMSHKKYFNEKEVTAKYIST
jgi:cell division septation protein DedD